MKELNVLIGGETGYGISDAGGMISRLFGRLGYKIYMTNDFPSLVRGGHQFVRVRASSEMISAHKNQADIVIAFDQNAVDLHRREFGEETIVIYDSEKVLGSGVTLTGVSLPLGELLKEVDGTREMGNNCMIGALCKVLNIDIALYENLINDHSSDKGQQKIAAARKGYELARNFHTFNAGKGKPLPVMSGSQAISTGLLNAGLQAYVAYPMTPTSPVMEFLASVAPEFELHAVAPESEIAVMLMALGYSYMGVRSAVGTSGGGFSLMVEGLGLAGIAELPVVVVMGQRAGPSTGMPTYTAQTDLHFVLNAGQGEFPRLILAPGDAEEAFYWSGVALNKAWKYQLPAFILTDKTLGLSFYSADLNFLENKEESPVFWNKTEEAEEYKRYRNTEDGISPLAFPPVEEQVIKVNSYVHDEYGLASEDPKIAVTNTDKRFLKEKNLAADLEKYETVKVYQEGTTALLCWGTNKGVCIEIGKKFGLKVIQLILLSPFPEKALQQALQGVDKLIGVECNSTGQLAMLLKQHGFETNDQILKYDGRPFSVDELENRVKKVMK